MALLDDFNAAAAKSKTLTQRPSNEELLNLYSLYKQATEGDNDEVRPGGFDFKAIAKHDAWAEQKGKSKDDAMREYVEFVGKLLAGN
jgi:diazepam-binding inhibitor (GABA receptor modulator, acyl-CoA-binding protein)